MKINDKVLKFRGSFYFVNRQFGCSLLSSISLGGQGSVTLRPWPGNWRFEKRERDSGAGPSGALDDNFQEIRIWQRPGGEDSRAVRPPPPPLGLLWWVVTYAPVSMGCLLLYQMVNVFKIVWLVDFFSILFFFRFRCDSVMALLELWVQILAGSLARETLAEPVPFKVGWELFPQGPCVGCAWGLAVGQISNAQCAASVRWD